MKANKTRDVVGSVVSLTDLVLFLLMLSGAAWLIWWQNNRPDAGAVATLIGALFGGAAVLLGNWINRLNDKRLSQRDAAERLERLRTAVTAELVDLATSLIRPNEFVSVSLVQVEARGGLVPMNLMSYLPPEMPYTFGQADLLLLTTKQIDALMMLRANLRITTRQMVETSSDTGGTGLLAVSSLAAGLRHTTAITAECFEKIAPERMFTIFGKEPELFSDLLKRLAAGKKA